MAFPMLPFVAGAVAGGLATLIYKDEKTRNAIKETSSNASEKTRTTSRKVSNKLADGLSRLSDKLRTEEKRATPSDSQPSTPQQ